MLRQKLEDGQSLCAGISVETNEHYRFNADVRYG
jgi:hypothetical protein